MTRSRRRTAVRTLATAVAVTGGLVLVPTTAASAAAPEDCAYMGYGSYPDQLGLQFDVSEQWVADNINAYRAQNGVPALAWWKQSPGHNALLLSRDYTTYAVGFAYQGHNAEEGYWVVMFGDH
jgi:hypothetical protein